MSLPSVDTGIYALLAGSSGVTALVSTRIYNLQAPGAASKPYIIFYLASGRIPNTSPRDVLDYVYRIESVATTRASAEAIQQAVYAAVHEQTITVSGWSNYWCVGENIITLIENTEGVQIWRYIGDYRVKLST